MTSQSYDSHTSQLIDGRFQVLRDLGSGRDGRVCLAADRVREVRVAIKWVDTNDARQAGALHAEYELGTRLTHPGWTQVLERGRDGSTEYFTMEYVEGTPLPGRMDSLALGEILGLLHQSCGALAALHAQHVVHADLNPDHLLVVDREQGARIKILDLSLAVRLGEQGPGSESHPGPGQRRLVRGTLEFASNSVLEGNPPTALDDLFALGASFERSLSQRERQLADDKQAADTLVEVLHRMTTADPDERYQSARQVQHELARAWPADTPPPPIDPGRGPLLGRDHEIAALESSLDAFAARPGGTLTAICGPSGSGKSRLLAEFRRRAHLRDLSVASIGAPGSSEWSQLQRELCMTHARGNPELARQLEGFPEPDGDQGIPGATAALLQCAAMGSPLIVVLEDNGSEAMDPSALESLVEALLGLPAETPLWIVAPAVSNLACSATSRWSTSSLQLKPLSRADSALLSREFLTQDSPWLEARIHDHCQGHPGFTEAATRAVAHPGARHDLSLARLDRIIHAELPESLEASIRQRLSQLPARAHELAEQLAVFSSGVRDTVLARFVDGEIDPASSTTLSAAGVVLRRSDPSGRAVMNVAESFRRVLIAGVDPEAWARLNLRALAAWKPESDDSLRAIAMASHAVESGERALALNETVSAADALLADQAAEPAFHVLVRCLEHCDQGRTDQESALAPILARLGECHFRLGRLEHADRCFERAVVHLAPEAQPVQLWSRWGEVLDAMGQPERAREKLQHALSGAGSEESHRVADACGILGRLEFRLGDPKAAHANFERGLAALHDHAPCQLAASLQNDLGVLAYHSGRFEDAVQRHMGALGIREGLNDQDGIARSLTNLGSVHMSRGHYRSARESYQASLRIKRNLSNQQSIALTLSNLALLDHWLGRYSSSIERHEEALRIRTDIGATPDQVRSLTHLSRVFHEKGAFPHAMRHADDGLALAERSGERDEGFILVQCARAEIMNSVGWGSRARPVIEDGLRASAALDHRVGHGVLRCLRAEQLIQTEPASEQLCQQVRGELEASIEALRQLDQPHVLAEALLRASMVLLDGPGLEMRVEWIDEGAEIAGALEAAALIVKADILRGYAGISALRPNESSKHFFAALDGARSLATPDLLWRAYAGLATFQECFGRRDRSLLWLQRCIGVFRRVVDRMPDESMQAAYLESPARNQIIEYTGNWANLAEV